MMFATFGCKSGSKIFLHLVSSRKEPPMSPNIMFWMKKCSPERKIGSTWSAAHLARFAAGALDTCNRN